MVHSWRCLVLRHVLSIRKKILTSLHCTVDSFKKREEKKEREKKKKKKSKKKIRVNTNNNEHVIGTSF